MTVRTTISMPDDLWEQVDAQQKDTGASVSEIVRRALDTYFTKAAPKTVKAAPKPVKAATNGNGRKPAAKTPKIPTPVPGARKRVVKAK